MNKQYHSSRINTHVFISPSEFWEHVDVECSCCELRKCSKKKINAVSNILLTAFVKDRYLELTESRDERWKVITVLQIEDRYDAMNIFFKKNEPSLIGTPFWRAIEYWWPSIFNMKRMTRYGRNIFALYWNLAHKHMV